MLAIGANIGKAHAIGRKHARQRMNKHGFHAEIICNQTRMLRACPAKAIQRIGCDVITALHGDLLDGVRHILNGNLDKAFGHRFRRAARFLGQVGKLLGNRLPIQRRIPLRPENLREVFRVDLAQHHIGIRNSQRPAAPITGRPGIGTS